jgi:hypothetical protein
MVQISCGANQAPEKVASPNPFTSTHGLAIVAAEDDLCAVDGIVPNATETRLKAEAVTIATVAFRRGHQTVEVWWCAAPVGDARRDLGDRFWDSESSSSLSAHASRYQSDAARRAT